MRRLQRVLFWVFALMVSAVHGADVYREDFVGGTNGWACLAGPLLQHTNEMLRVTFVVPPPPAPPIPTPATLYSGAAASGGAFTGSYQQAGISLLGFRIRALTLTNSAPVLRWASGTNMFIRAFGDGIAQTGAWYNYATSLKDVSETEWSQEGQATLDREHFAACLTNVTEVRIVINNPSAMFSSQFELDAIYADQLPTAESAHIAGTDAVIVWSPLQTDLTYTVQDADMESGTWALVVALNPTARTHSIAIPLGTNAGPRSYRLKN